MSAIDIIGLDLATNVVAVHCVDATGKPGEPKPAFHTPLPRTHDRQAHF